MDVEGEHPFTPGDEIDEVRWLTIDDAMSLLSYERDTEVVRSLAPGAVRGL